MNKLTKEEKMEIAQQIKEFALKLHCNVDIRFTDEVRIMLPQYKYVK